MKVIKSGLILAAAMCLAPVAGADEIIEAWTCELKDDVSVEDVQATNSKWLKWVNDNAEGGEIKSAVGTPIIGNLEVFLFVDTYPDLATWAAAKDALDSDAADELDDMFDELSECSKNRLWKMEDTK